MCHTQIATFDQHFQHRQYDDDDDRNATQHTELVIFLVSLCLSFSFYSSVRFFFHVIRLLLMLHYPVCVHGVSLKIDESCQQRASYLVVHHLFPFVGFDSIFSSRAAIYYSSHFPPLLRRVSISFCCLSMSQYNNKTRACLNFVASSSCTYMVKYTFCAWFLIPYTGIHYIGGENLIFVCLVRFLWVRKTSFPMGHVDLYDLIICVGFGVLRMKGENMGK